MSQSARRRPVRGPRFTASARLPIEGRKRRAVLALVAAYADAGVEDPSIAELVAGARLDRIAVVAVVDRLERDGLLEVERTPHERNRYRLLFAPARSSEPSRQAAEAMNDEAEERRVLEQMATTLNGDSS